MKQTKVAIQGAHGSFHEVAAIKYFGEEVKCIECMSFKDVFNHVMSGDAGFGITAIENTVAGTILPNYAMLRNSKATVIGEIYLHIQQNLITLKGQTIEDIKEVHSHPMAILQCQNFFEQYPHIRMVEADDTAAVAKRISEKQLKNIGAIAGTHVAGIYDLQLLAEAIETHKKNFTRFLVIKATPSSVSPKGGDTGVLNSFPFGEGGDGVNKSSLYFSVAHRKGSLATVLTKLAEHDINLTKIQSLPIVGREWEYYIHVDMEFNDYKKYKTALNEIMPSLSELKILGEYKRGIKVEAPDVQLEK